MSIKVALFGPAEMVKLVKELESNVEGIEIIPYVYQTPRETEQLIQQAFECDIYLFSGIIPYYYSKKFFHMFDRPAIYIPDNELSVSLTLLSIFYRHQVGFNRLSIDLPDRKYVDRVMKQLEMQPEALYVQDYPWMEEEHHQDFQVDYILSMHRKLWNQGKVDLIITSIHAVFDQLKQENIPCVRMLEPERNIIDSLKEAKMLGELQQSQQAQVALGYVKIEPLNDKDHKVNSHIYQGLMRLAKSIHCTLQQSASDFFVLYGTKGSMEFLVKNSDLLDPFYLNIEQQAKVAKIGLGFGLTIVEAERNAHIALSYSEKVVGENAIHIVTEEQTVINPRKESLLVSVLKSENEEVVQLAKSLKISVTNVMKMVQFLASRPMNRFTASDVADYLEVSKRSAERLLKKFADGGYLYVIGEEQPFQNGRPRSIYRLDLPFQQYNQ
ncbi:hypothetical protein [Bacillus sp. REN10]|uniref:hypothetical protein n=1 Tax=Bacillus sp. REN10 TaxID=2782541 RepID=UPI00193BCDE7|nr:hypothetical protein [Bacillus sp. REN10]